jgi:PAS domain S-box-containing protein
MSECKRRTKNAAPLSAALRPGPLQAARHKPSLPPPQIKPHNNIDTLLFGPDYARTPASRRRTQAAIRQCQECYRILYEDNPAMYFIVDASGTIISVNRFGAEQLGYTAAELAGQPVLRVVYEEDQNAVQQQLVECLQNPGRSCHWEFRKVRKDGSLLWVKEAARAVKDAAGRPIVLIVCEDLTSHKQMEATLRASEERFRNVREQERRRLAQELHDSLEQMLVALQCHLEAAEKSLKDNPPAARESLVVAKKLALATLKEDRRILMDLMPSALDTLRIEAALQKLCENFSQLGGPRVSFIPEGISARLRPALETGIYRIAQEALNNAIKHARAQTVRVQLLYGAEQISLLVEDDGEGFQVEPHEPGGEERRGIGLANMRDRAHALHGALEIISGLGRGTKILARLPIPPFDAEASG